MVTFCKKCLIPESQFEYYQDEDNDEEYCFCPNCRSDLDFTTSEVMPTKKEVKIICGELPGKKFNLVEWEKKRIEFETESDRRLNEYIKDFGNFGKEAAEHNYFNQKSTSHAT